jgi:hypothetical protein
MPLREGVKLKSSRYSKRYELRRARHHGGELLPPLRDQLAGRGLSRVDERAEGGHARAHNLRAQREDLRAQREAAELFATERLASVMARTLDKLEELLASDDDAVAMRAVDEVLDRVIGAQQAATSTRARLDWTSICWPSARSLLVSWNGVHRSSCRERYKLAIRLHSRLQRPPTLQAFHEKTPPERGFLWSGRRGSNPRPSAWEADALPTELRPRAAQVSAGMRSVFGQGRGVKCYTCTTGCALFGAT